MTVAVSELGQGGCVGWQWLVVKAGTCYDVNVMVKSKERNARTGMQEQKIDHALKISFEAEMGTWQVPADR